MTNAKPPLHGIRVLDIASLYAAPFAATLLGDFGAEVIKIEPPDGDGFRGTGMWAAVGRGKKSVVLDLRSPEGCETLRQLCRTADIIVQNFPRSVLEKRGIGWDRLHTMNPKLIMLSVSCFGQTGPYADRPGSGTIGEGFAGLTHLTGRPEDKPMLASVALGDAIGAMSAVMGALAALYGRDMGGGGGQEIDASLWEPVLTAISGALAAWQPGDSPGRMSGRLGTTGIRNTYRTADGGHVVLSASTPRHLNDMTELANWDGADDPDAAVARWIGGLPQLAVIDALVARRIPVAPVTDLDRLISDPHVLARGSVRQGTIGGRRTAYAAPHPRLEGLAAEAPDIDRPLGADTAEVLGALKETANVGG
ncbi:CaiB/BaiF CoA transferase family protein [Tropicimonas isoalkanivorans]|uniref:Formyl-CoA transferase n=1 Tax=Tropicimonas isoalkanivorans TaxID=441112 RepID=A0A1I1HZY7_9RHOB|nr:CoA transferase [Tropicimonas isoalkanivorans]SFC29411.1 formyl-CoA transferase [Tropicimonas isoalkanivorans]